jgi:hypothetical protein
MSAEPKLRPRETEVIIDLIREVGVCRLSLFDGCSCGGFTVRNVEVDICCGKGRDRGVWVSSPSLDWEFSKAALAAIADEVASQVEDADFRGPMPRYPFAWKRDERDPPV